ncbi:hypothetical protein SH668x_000948 [Planctomicrobium sp. SH668]|uniref:hypothetical protein n=1 Tax=Planctomicrobium sp. SH668 TaxID=3448126 RepID=UPI003F5B2525
MSGILLKVSLVALLLMVALSGCTKAPQAETPKPDAATATTDLKQMLGPLASSGVASSAITAIPGKIEAIKASDAALATSLEADYQKLSTAKSPGEIKSTAAKMLKQLK